MTSVTRLNAVVIVCCVVIGFGIGGILLVIILYEVPPTIIRVYKSEHKHRTLEEKKQKTSETHPGLIHEN